MARNAVRAGIADCVLVVGFEQMAAGPLTGDSSQPSPIELSAEMMHETRGKFNSPQNAQFFANAGREYMRNMVRQRKTSQRSPASAIRTRRRIPMRNSKLSTHGSKFSIHQPYMHL
jgi:acetyl-CoA acetyltransferase